MNEKFVKKFNYCKDLYQQKKYKLAFSRTQELNRKSPKNPHVIFLLSVLADSLDKVQYAKSCFEDLLKNDNDLSYKYQYALFLTKRDFFCEAKKHFQELVRQSPQTIHYLRDFAQLLLKLGHIKDSEMIFRKALQIDKNDTLSQYSLAIVLLKLGKLEEGWALYESRFIHKYISQLIVPSCKQVSEGKVLKWKGQDLTNKTLLVEDEQGFGDFIQFFRYLKVLKEKFKNIKIILICKEPLIQLVENSKIVDSVISKNNKNLIERVQADYFAFLLSIPGYFEKSYEDLKRFFNIPYFIESKENKFKNSKLISNDLINIGIVWRGNSLMSNDKYRSLNNISLLDKFSELKNINMLSMQIEDVTDDINKSNLQIHDAGKEISNFQDTLDLIKCLDLVITVDTAAAHLAGSINKMCFVMLSNISAHWVYRHDNSQCPWYKNFKVFQQDTSGDWGKVIESILSEVSKLNKSDFAS